jgi:hypothetical protein
MLKGMTKLPVMGNSKKKKDKGLNGKLLKLQQLHFNELCLLMDAYIKSHTTQTWLYLCTILILSLFTLQILAYEFLIHTSIRKNPLKKKKTSVKKKKKKKKGDYLDTSAYL